MLTSYLFSGAVFATCTNVSSPYPSGTVDVGSTVVAFGPFNSGNASCNATMTFTVSTIRGTRPKMTIQKNVSGTWTDVATTTGGTLSTSQPAGSFRLTLTNVSYPAPVSYTGTFFYVLQ